MKTSMCCGAQPKTKKLDGRDTLIMKNSLILQRQYFFFLQPHLQHMEVPRPAVKWELQLQAYATATSDLSHICDLHHSLL